jgi:hypothetical protein
VLINSPACFGFQVPSSGGYNFLIYKLLQSVCVSGRCGLLFLWCGHLLWNAPQFHSRGKGGRCVELTLPPSCAECLKIWDPNLLEPSGPVQACNGTALPFTPSSAAVRMCHGLRQCRVAVDSHLINSTLPAYGRNVPAGCSVGVVLDRRGTALSGQCLKKGTMDVPSGRWYRCVKPSAYVKTWSSVVKW